jgi:hypothetical protein
MIEFIFDCLIEFLKAVFYVAFSYWYLKRRGWKIEPPMEFRYKCPEKGCHFKLESNSMEWVDEAATDHGQTFHNG